MALPDIYKQVEYIESSNTQYIKIGNSWNSSYKTEAVLQITGTVDVMFGIRDDIANVHRYGLRGQDGYFKGVTGSQSGISQTTFPLDTNKHNISLYNGTLTIDGNSYSVYNTSNVSFSNGMTIFGYTLGSTSGAASYFRVFSFKVYNGTTLLYDLVPALRKSDNKPGLYDLVNNVFYTNQGTGEFSYPAQSGKIKKIYVGTQQVRPESQYITETYQVTSSNLPCPIYKQGYVVESVLIELDYNNPSSGWTGLRMNIWDNNGNGFGGYFRGGDNNSSYNNSAGKLTGHITNTETKIIDLSSKNYAGTTTHFKIYIDREKCTITVGTQNPETYLYSSGSRGSLVNSLLNSNEIHINGWCSSGIGSFSNGVATVTYTQN